MSTPAVDPQEPAKKIKARNNDKERKKSKAKSTADGTREVDTSAAGPHEQDVAAIRQRLAVLCQDLRTFSASEDAALRLNTSVHAHFLGPPYLSEAQAEYVRAMTVGELRRGTTGEPEATTRSRRPGEPSGEGPESSAGQGDDSKTLSAFLEEGMAALVAARRAKSERAVGEDGGGERDFVMCTSHDLAPLLQEACGFPKQHFETRAFKDAYKRWEKEVRKASKKGKGQA
ncbi:hypothetical protein OH77DRAFT_1431837 [Trametes cingulata]|nr:hypothetical protein OH77DRAFT_1431837 [Trametes cingulata]